MNSALPLLLVLVSATGCGSQTNDHRAPLVEYERIHADRTWGFVNAQGDTLIPLGRYEFLNPIDKEGMILAHRDGREGYIDINEKILIPFQYEEIGVFSNGLAPAKMNGAFGMVDRSGNRVVDFKYDELRYLYSCGLAQARIGTHWGFIDRTGVEVIPLEFEAADYNKVDPCVAAMRGGKWAFFDGMGNQLTAYSYDELFESLRADGEYSFFPAGLAKVRIGKSFGYIDTAFREVIHPGVYDEVSAFNADSLAIVSKNGRFGVIHVSGSSIVPLTYDEIRHPARYSHVSGNFIARVGSRYQLLDQKAKALTKAEMLAIEMDHTGDEDHFIIRSVLGAVGVLSPAGDTLLAFRYDQIRPFDGRSVAIAATAGGWGLVSINDHVVVPFENTSITTNRFFKHYIVERKGKVGVLSRDGQVLLPFDFEKLEPCYYDEDNRYLAQRGGMFGLIDIEGRVIIPFVYDTISNWIEYGPEEHICIKDKRYSLVARDGSVVVEDLTQEQFRQFLSSR